MTGEGEVEAPTQDRAPVPATEGAEPQGGPMDLSEENVDAFYKKMLVRAPNKRQIKPVARKELLNRLDLKKFEKNEESESESDEDYKLNEEPTQSSESENSEPDESNHDSDEKASGDDSDVLNGSSDLEKSGADETPEAQMTEREFQWSNDNSTIGFATGNSTPQFAREEPLKLTTMAPSTFHSSSVLICSVCLKQTSEANDEIVECDSCGVCVHEGCYGVSDTQSIASTDSSASTEPWFCDSCKAGVLDPLCQVCPNRGGIFKETDMGDWIHMICALYVPGIAFSNIDTLSNVTLFEIASSRFGSKECQLCEDESISRTGITIGCDAGLCRAHFHASCAQRLGLLSETRPEKGAAPGEPDPYWASCKQHVDKDIARVNKRNWMAAQAHVRGFKSHSIIDALCHERIQRKLAKRQAKYGVSRGNRLPTWIPAQKMARAMESSPSAVEILHRKAEQMGIGVTNSQAHRKHVLELQMDEGKKKGYVAPAFSVEFITYFAERNNRVAESRRRQVFLEEQNENLKREEFQLRQKYEQEIQKTEEQKKITKSTQDAFIHLWRLIECVSGKTYELPKSLRRQRRRISGKCQVPPPPHGGALSIKTKALEPRGSIGAKIKVSKSRNTPAETSPILTLSPVKDAEKSPENGILETLLHQCKNCHGKNEQFNMIDCDTCKEWYHLACLEPPLTRMPKKTKKFGWACSECTAESEDEEDEEEKLIERAKEPRQLRNNRKKPKKFEDGEDGDGAPGPNKEGTTPRSREVPRFNLASKGNATPSVAAFDLDSAGSRAIRGKSTPVKSGSAEPLPPQQQTPPPPLESSPPTRVRRRSNRGKKASVSLKTSSLENSLEVLPQTEAEQKLLSSMTELIESLVESSKQQRPSESVVDPDLSPSFVAFNADGAGPQLTPGPSDVPLRVAPKRSPRCVAKPKPFPVSATLATASNDTEEPPQKMPRSSGRPVAPAVESINSSEALDDAGDHVESADSGDTAALTPIPSPTETNDDVFFGKTLSEGSEECCKRLSISGSFTESAKASPEIHRTPPKSTPTERSSSPDRPPALESASVCNVDYAKALALSPPHPPIFASQLPHSSAVSTPKPPVPAPPRLHLPPSPTSSPTPTFSSGFSLPPRLPALPEEPSSSTPDRDSAAVATPLRVNTDDHQFDPFGPVSQFQPRRSSPGSASSSRQGWKSPKKSGKTKSRPSRRSGENDSSIEILTSFDQLTLASVEHNRGDDTTTSTTIAPEKEDKKEDVFENKDSAKKEVNGDRKREKSFFCDFKSIPKMPKIKTTNADFDLPPSIFSKEETSADSKLCPANYSLAAASSAFTAGQQPKRILKRALSNDGGVVDSQLESSALLIDSKSSDEYEFISSPERTPSPIKVFNSNKREIKPSAYGGGKGDFDPEIAEQEPEVDAALPVPEASVTNGSASVAVEEGRSVDQQITRMQQRAPSKRRIKMKRRFSLDEEERRLAEKRAELKAEASASTESLTPTRTKKGRKTAAPENGDPGSGVNGESTTETPSSIKSPKKANSPPIICQTCKEVGKKSNTATCSSCNFYFHVACIDSVLNKVPKKRSGSWKCDFCRICEPSSENGINDDAAPASSDGDTNPFPDPDGTENDAGSANGVECGAGEDLEGTEGRTSDSTAAPVVKADGEAVFSCSQCDKEFKSDFQRVRHVNTVHNGLRFDCDLCSKSFTNKAHVNRHVQSVHLKIQHHCELCDKKFTRKDRLTEHLKSSHSPSVENDAAPLLNDCSSV